MNLQCRKVKVNIQAICDYNLTTDSEGVYYISDADDLVAFARIVEAGQTDANAKGRWLKVLTTVIIAVIGLIQMLD